MLRAILSLCFVCAWEVFRLFYYDAWLANTAIAKPWPGVQDLGFRQLARYVAPPLAALVTLRLSQRGLILRRYPSILSLILLLTAAGVIFVVYAQIDWMYFGRFAQPIAPLIAVAFALTLSAFELPAGSAVRIVLILLFLQLVSWLPQSVRYYKNDGFAMLMRDDDPLIAGIWLHDHLPPDLTLATSRLGAIAYTNMGRTIWDYDGLTDREQAIFDHSGSAGPSPIERRHPNIIVEADVPAPWSYRNDMNEIRALERDYLLIKRFRQGNFGSMDVWLRKADSLRIFAPHDH